MEGTRSLASSRYPEDVLVGNHTSIFGSFYDTKSGRWGFRCCKQYRRKAACRPQLGPAAPQAALLPPPTREGSEPTPDEVQEQPVLEEAQCESSDEDPVDLGEGNEATAAAAEKVRAEVARVLGVAPGQHLEVLGLEKAADAHAVRRAHRRLLLLIHPDKNPGYEDDCKEALVRAQEAREALEASGGAPAAKGEEVRRAEKANAGFPAQRGANSRKAKRRPSGVPPDLAEHAEAKAKEAFESDGEFVIHTLKHHLFLWRESGLSAGFASKAAQSRAAFEEAASSVGSLLHFVEEGMLGKEPLGKLEKMCSHLMAREYMPANQVYMDLAIGNKTWHADVPTLLEGGMSWDGRKAGVERGKLFKQARVAERLNRERRENETLLDSEDVKGYITSLKRLLTVSQELRPE